MLAAQSERLLSALTYLIAGQHCRSVGQPHMADELHSKASACVAEVLAQEFAVTPHVVTMRLETELARINALPMGGQVAGAAP